MGEGDELLLVDLDAADAPEDLARHAGGRAYEVGRRWIAWRTRAAAGVEAVVAVVRETRQEI